MSELIHEITEVGAFRTDDMPARLIVEVGGMASSAGWTNVRLERQTYLTPPEDGILEFDLVGDRPTEAADVMTSVVADYVGDDEEWVTGVRIHGAANEVETGIVDDLDDEDEDDAAEEDDDDANESDDDAEDDDAEDDASDDEDDADADDDDSDDDDDGDDDGDTDENNDDDGAAEAAPKAEAA